MRILLRSTVAVLWVAMVLGTGDAKEESLKKEKPSIEIRPELFLGWTKEKPAPENKRLPWQVTIALTVVDESGKTMAGPMTVSAAQEFTGSSFSKIAQVKTAASNEPAAVAQPDQPSNAAPGTASAKSVTRITVQNLDFAAQVLPKGGNIVYMKSFVRLMIVTGEQADTYQMTTTVECRPDQDTVVATFPGAVVHMKVSWTDSLTN